jgi:amino acid adenylation domain-containing protein
MTASVFPGGTSIEQENAVSGRLLSERVGEQAGRTPMRPAAVCADGTLTYAELDVRANRLAQVLRANGTGPETVVGVHLRRGLDLVVALLAVWRAGAAYLPLDPEHPQDRTAWMLADAGASVLLTHAALDDLPAEVRAAGVAVLRPDSAVAEAGADRAPQPAADPEAAAYVIYTSGSTGRPKGVVVTQGGIANRVGWAVRHFGLAATDRVLQKTSLSFDAACWEFFAPLTSGGTVVLAPDGAERDPATMLRAVAAERITVLQVVPSVLRLLLQEPGWADCTDLRLVCSAGEVLHAQECRRLLELAPVEIWNTYGPTECAIDVSAHRVDPAQTHGPVPIGGPIDNTRLLVLDPDGDPVPVGVSGELHAGGAGLARGYLGRPELTADRFVPDPYGPAGARLYRTGDLVRWRADGVLEYLGRLDLQVKVNGVRIEPGEVESALQAHPDVRAAVVGAHSGPDGAARLVAHVVAEGGTEPQQLRDFLRDRLPTALIPSVFVLLPALPLTSSGKVDRKALPAPDLAQLTDPSTAVAPRTEAERTVAAIWSDLLGVGAPSVHDNFFQLGGTSLMLTRLANRMRAATGGRVPLRGLFAAATLEAQARLIDTVDEEPIGRIPDGSELVPSFGQQRLWFLDRMHPGSREWVAPLFVRLPAGVTPEAVRQSLDAVAARHEVLRTRYPAEGGRPRLVVDPPGPVELTECESGPEQLSAVLRAELGRGFDLAAGPIWRALLVHRPQADPLLLVTAHHIACDGWSSRLLEREIRDCCTAFSTGGRPAPAPLPVRYADFARWQRDQLTDDVRARELAHWRGTLDRLEPLELPTDRPRPPERDPDGAVVPFVLAPAVVAEVERLARACSGTPFMVLLSAFAALLGRYTGSDDVAIGSPVAGRSRPEVEPVVGFFLNSLVLRCDLSGRPDFSALVERTRAGCLAAFAHQALPFEHLVDELQPTRDLSRTPLYQVAFDLHDDDLTGGGADTSELETYQEIWTVAKTDLTLFMRRRPDGSMAAVLEYATALFDRDTVERMAAHFATLLERLLSAGATPVDEVGLLPAEERQLLADWNAAAGDGVDAASVLGGACVPAAFDAQVARTPDAIAVEAGGRQLSYAQLAERVNRLARHLHTLGVASDSDLRSADAVVAVLLERGIDLLVALLAVWKADAAYLPLDPGHPPERLTAMLTDARASALITQTSLVHPGATSGPWARVVVDDPTTAATIAALPGFAPDSDPAPEQLAYVIFTSGSTGRPKGVAVTHRALANHVAWAAQQLARRGTGGGALFSSVAFDLVVPNLWAPLVTGRRLWLAAPDTDLSELGRELSAAAPFSFLKLTPAHLDVVAHGLTPAQARSLAEVIVVAGEPFTAAVLDRWRALDPDTPLINEYGPTEATVGTCIFDVQQSVSGAAVPIGRPLPGMRMYVLDRQLNPVPIGVPGELHVGGVGVARGYLNRPGLTADRFGPDPFGPPGARLYRTGDLVRHRPDGAVEFLHRLDDQVKIRGHRVELGEVRAVLLQHPQITDVVVSVRELGAGDQRLVAHLVLAAGTVAGAGVAGHCARLLPEHMIPSAFVPVERIPLTRNGKVDRRALPDPGEVEAREQTPPRNETEQRIVEIWAGLLGPAPIGIHDNFFHIGGNSILAIRMLSGIQDAFEVELAVRAIFERPTVAGLAETVQDRIRTEIDAMSDAEVLSRTTALKERNV